MNSSPGKQCRTSPSLHQPAVADLVGEPALLYARGLCVRAIAEQVEYLVVYRAKVVDDPRPESEALIGKRLDPNTLLADLRASLGVDTALGLARPNSGLSVRLP